MYIIFLAAYSGADEPGQLHLQLQQPFQTQTAQVFGELNFSADELICRLHENWDLQCILSIITYLTQIYDCKDEVGCNDCLLSSPA